MNLLCWGLFNAESASSHWKNPCWYSLPHPNTLWQWFLASSTPFGLQNYWMVVFWLIFGEKGRCKTAHQKGNPFWPISHSDARLAHQKVPRNLDPGIRSCDFCLRAFAAVTSAWRRWVGPSMADDISMMTSVGWRGRVTSRWVGKQRVVYGFRCTTFEQKVVSRKELRHNREGDAWREYGGKIAHLPDANLLAGWRERRLAHHRFGAR